MRVLIAPHRTVWYNCIETGFKVSLKNGAIYDGHCGVVVYLFSGTAGKIQPNLPHRYNRIAVEKLCILLKKYKREKRDWKL